MAPLYRNYTGNNDRFDKSPNLDKITLKITPGTKGFNQF